MDAAAVIKEIKRLPRAEQEQIMAFVQSLESRRPTAEKLSEYEKMIVAAKDSAEAQRLREEIVAGFYGNETGALHA